MKGRKATAPGGSRSGNNTGSAEPQLRGKAVPATQGKTRNQPNTTSGSGAKAKIGVGVADTYHANSRGAVDKKFDRHSHD